VKAGINHKPHANKSHTGPARNRKTDNTRTPCPFKPAYPGSNGFFDSRAPHVIPARPAKHERPPITFTALVNAVTSLSELNEVPSKNVLCYG
jgi:hypothetical protein